MSLSDSVERIYRQFAGYSCPANLWVCEQYGPEWSAARHLVNAIDAVFTTREPFESASKTTVLDWLANPAVGLRLEHACYAANSSEAAQQLSAAHELWTVCAR